MSDEAPNVGVPLTSDGRIVRAFNNLEGFRDAFARSHNPFWAWAAIEICAKNGLDFPPWLRAYLSACAKRMQSADALQAKDLRTVLPGILGFDKPGPGQSLRANVEARKSERFALTFARELLAGKTPAEARKDASLEIDGPNGPDDKTLQRRLKRFFEPNPAPRDPERWRRVVAEWLLKNPSCCSRYPGLPEPSKLWAYLSPSDQVTIWADGRITLKSRA